MRVILVFVSMILASFTQQSTCPQLCNDCSSCNFCYDGFETDASLASVSECSCPQGFFENSQTGFCNFCPPRCVTCVDSDTCTSCLEGYDLIDSECILNSINNQIMEIQLDLDDEKLSNYWFHGYQFIGAAVTKEVENYFDSCSGMPTQAFFGGLVFDYETSIIRTYYGLPPHQWIHMKISLFLIDEWIDDEIVLQIQDQMSITYNPKQFNDTNAYTESKTYSSSGRRDDFCQDSYPDNLGKFDRSLSHTSSILKWRIILNLDGQVRSNLAFGIRDVLLIVGFCPQQCSWCVSTTRCGGCQQYYKLSSSFQCVCDEDVAIQTDFGCIPKCASQQIYLQPQQKCVQCSHFIQGCVDCSESTYLCTDCGGGYLLLDGICVHACPIGYERNGVSCSQCEEGCLACAQNKCVSCLPGYLWSFGECLEECPSTTYPNEEGQCVACGEGCASCVSSSECQTCQVGYEQHYGKCLLLCEGTENLADDGCQISCAVTCEQCFGNSVSQCLYCTEPYKLQEHTCVNTCSPGYFQQGTACEKCPYSCSTCDYSGCDSCYDGFYLYKMQCLRICPLGYYYGQNNQCSQCEEDCYQCASLSECQECEDGLVLIGGTCQQIAECSEGSYLQQGGTKCLSCPVHCDICEKTLCVDCEDDWYLNNGKCVEQCPSQKYPSNGKCLWKDPLCDKYQQDECTACKYMEPALFLVEQICKFSCPEGKTQSLYSTTCDIDCPTDCVLCSETSCLKCDTGLFLDDSNDCVEECGDYYTHDQTQCLPCTEGCVKCTLSGFCLECEAGLILHDGLCVEECSNGNCECYEQCESCVYYDYCTSCPNGTVLWYGYCFDECNDGYFYDDVSGECRSCLPECKYCQYATECSSCATGLYMHRGRCISQCPLGYYIDIEAKECASCSPSCRSCYGKLSSQCLTCHQGYKMDHTTCLKECPTGKYEDEYGHCDKCSIFCEDCYGPADFQCLDCKEGALYHGYCEEICPSGTYDNADGSCVQCDWGCKECVSYQECSLCFSGYYLIDHHCVQLCPDHYYHGGNDTCLSCGESCLSCTFHGCTHCQEDYYLFNNSCVQACAISTFYHDGTRQCLSCGQNCEECDDWGDCQACFGNYYLIDGVCLPFCAPHYFYDDYSESCGSCAPNCDACTSMYSCHLCSEEHYLFDQSCLKQCPSGYYRCQSGYCLPCPLSCVQCSSPLSCSACEEHYHLQYDLCLPDQPVACHQSCSLCLDESICLICMVPYYLSNGNCVEQCATGEYMSGRSCLPCHAACGECDGQNCITCKQNLMLWEGSCLIQCPAGLYSEDGECYYCNDNCTMCSSESQCLRCSPPLVLFEGECRINCPIGLYFDTQFQSCMNCSANCSTCISFQQCIQCQTPYYLANGRCISSCPLTSYINSTGKCAPCQYPCRQCDNPTQCTRCVSGFTLNFTQCVKSCGVRHYSNSSVNGSCQKCSHNCLTCQTNSTTCTSCSEGFYLQGVRCLRSCPVSTYMSPDNRCLPCSSYCLDCVDSMYCISCHESMVKFNGKCVSKCPDGYTNTSVEENTHHSIMVSTCTACVSPCLTCTSTSAYNCSSCLEGYYLNGNRCVENCSKGWYRQNITRECQSCASTCAQCESLSKCIQCKYGQDSATGACLPETPCVGSSCECSDMCEYCDMGYCRKCFEGYFLDNGTCVEDCQPFYPWKGKCINCDNNCNICSSPKQCKQCVDGLYLHKGKCVALCPSGTRAENGSCISYPCLWEEGQQCLSCISPFFLYDMQCVQSCPQGYFQSGAICSSCPSSCQSCTRYERCLTCEEGYNIYEGKCLNACPVGTYEEQNQCEPCNSICLECTNEEYCTKCLNGLSLLDGVCYGICGDGFYGEDGQCHQCSTGCNKCNDEGCVQCDNGYLLDGKCVQECVIGTYSITSPHASCQPCPLTCIKCRSSSSCFECIPSHFLYEGKCVSTCIPSTYLSLNHECLECDDRCEECYSESKCTKCKSGYFLHHYNCIQQCTAGYYAFDGVCMQCDYGCQQCDVDNCVSCLAGFDEGIDGRCYSECESRTFYNQSSQSCEVCSSQCQQCYGPLINQCLSCEHPFILFDGICVLSCPQQYYSIHGQCTVCPPSCKTCSSDGCLSCHSGDSLHNEACVRVCPPSYYSENKVCVSCSGDCAQCYGPLAYHCTSCESGKVLMKSGSCSSSCSPPLILINGVCRECQFLHCSVCQKDSCEVCLEGYMLWEGTCVEDCPSRTYVSGGECLYCEVSGCLQCSASSTCTKCSASFLYNNSCVETCPVGFQSSHGECVESTKTCLTLIVEESGECVGYCPSTHYKENQTCYRCDIGCMQCSQQQCFVCENQLFLHDGLCMQECPVGYLGMNQECIACSGCAACFGTIDSCISCEAGKFLFAQQCMNECPSGYEGVESTRICESCPAGCAVCSEGICSQCVNSLNNPPDCTGSCAGIQYQHADGNCYSCHSQCASCFGGSKYECLSCDGSKYLLGSQCIDTCPVGYTDENSLCVQCWESILHCSVCSSITTCSQCKKGYYLYDGECLESCQSLNTATHIYSALEGTCVACVQNCTLCQEGTCTYCKAGHYLHNQVCTSSCPAGTYAADFTCEQCSVECVECSSVDVCTSCGNKYLYDGQCIDECPLAFVSDNGVCLQCEIYGCDTCEIVNQLIECRRCREPLKASNGNCESCLAGYYYSDGCWECEAGCTSCTVDGCEECNADLYLVDGECDISCPSGYYPSSPPDCIACPSNCQSCNSVQCLLCSSSYYLYEGSCYSSCPIGTYTHSSLCLDCEVGCDSCLTSTECTHCENGFYLHSASCFLVCPSGTTHSSAQCVECKVGCRLCSNEANTCDQCEATTLVDDGNGGCTQGSSPCPSGQYENNNGQCQACYVLCGSCWGPLSTQCLTCRSSSYQIFDDGSCIGVCEADEYLSSSTNECISCSGGCTQCDESQCFSCENGKVLFEGECLDQCPQSTYLSNQKCKACSTGCTECTGQKSCSVCDNSLLLYNGECHSNCPEGSYEKTSTTCESCATGCSACTSSAICTDCESQYKMYEEECVDDCPLTTYEENGICLECSDYCLICVSDTQCEECEDGNPLYVDVCMSQCPPTTYNSDNVCTDCGDNCVACTSQTLCTQCQTGFFSLSESESVRECVSECPPHYNQQNQQCLHDNCMNCAICVDGMCQKCNDDFYLHQEVCIDTCPISYFASQASGECQSCIEDCLQCSNATSCDICVNNFNFTEDNGCVAEVYLLYGDLSNMSGFTSNITEVTSMVYLSTVPGPVVFGEVASTYFNIELCQLFLFHDSVAGDNEETQAFLQSLSNMAGTSGFSSPESTRRLLEAGSQVSFVEANVLIFALMGAFLLVFLLVHLMDRCLGCACQSCPKLHFYAHQICLYLKNRFKWIYFDFVAWLSYLPFIYFGLLQIQNMNFTSALHGISSLLSIVIIIVYPLYPVFITYLIKSSYRSVCLENDKMVEMSLSPYINQVKRPTQLPEENQFKYFTKDNFRLIYYPLKYFRKFLFVLVVALATDPVVALSALVGLNIIFIVYMAMLRPRKMPYMVFDFIIEGVLLGFQIFMLIYVSMDGSTVSIMSIITQGIGFITANLSIVIAIVLNIVAYYHIFRCIYDLVVVLKQKMEEKEKIEAREKQEGIEHIQNVDELRSDEIKTENLDEEERKITKFLTDKDLIANNIQPRYDNNIAYQQEENLFNEKEMNRKGPRNDDSLTEEEMKTQNLQQEERNITRFLNDKDLIANNIQPRYDHPIPQYEQQQNLFDEKEIFGFPKKQTKVYQNQNDSHKELPTIETKARKKKKIKEKDSKPTNNLFEDTETRLYLKNREQKVEEFQEQLNELKLRQEQKKKKKVQNITTEKKSEKKIQTVAFKNDSEIKLHQKKMDQTYLSSNESFLNDQSPQNIKLKEKKKTDLISNQKVKERGRPSNQEFDEFLEDQSNNTPLQQHKKSSQKIQLYEREKKSQTLDNRHEIPKVKIYNKQVKEIVKNREDFPEGFLNLPKNRSPELYFQNESEQFDDEINKVKLKERKQKTQTKIAGQANKKEQITEGTFINRVGKNNQSKNKIKDSEKKQSNSKGRNAKQQLSPYQEGKKKKKAKSNRQNQQSKKKIREGDSFEESEFEKRRPSKFSNVEKMDSGLNIDERNEDFQDSQVGRKRKSNMQIILGKKQKRSQMNILEKDGQFEESGDFTRPKKDSSRRSILKNQRLHINKNQNSEQEDDIESIQL